MNIPEIIQELCIKHNAYVKEVDGYFAVCRRHYNDDGIEEVRHTPDPCDFHPLDEWAQYGSALIN